MTKINLYETPKEAKRRAKAQEIRKEYLELSHDILSGKVLPNRVMDALGRKHGKTVMGIKYILRQAGIYQDAKHPVVMSANPSLVQLSMDFGGSDMHI